MTSDSVQSSDHDPLRRMAEELAGRKPVAPQEALSYADLVKLAQEIEVRRIELELRKERLGDVEIGLATYQELYDFAPIGYFTLDETGVILSVNLTGARLLGEERARLVDHPFHLFVSPEGHSTFGDFLRRVFTGADTYACELSLVRQRGGPLWAQLEGTPAIPGPGKTKQCRAVVMDITRRKQMEFEQRQIEERIRQAQKLESLGLIAGGIAHDFNNLLTVILGNAELALMNLSATLPAHGFIEGIVKASQRAADLTRQMLAYSGREPLAMKPLDLSELIEQTKPMAEVAISKKSSLHLFFAHSPLVVLADGAQLRQVIMNLLINASEAIGDREGAITVVTRCVHCDRQLLDRLRPDEALPEGRYACLEVVDTGCGMTPAILARACDPFFTTKFTGRGLGLAVVQGIVRSHCGAIEVESRVGIGTTVRVLLPGTGAVSPPVQAPSDDQPVWRGSGLVLLVDDEEMVRNLGKQLLERMGFTVLTAVDGGEAVTVFNEHAAEIAVVLLDLTMPRMDGRETLREIRRTRPEVPVLICSGYGEKHVLSLFADFEAPGFVQKPYQLTDLSVALRNILKRPSAG